MKVARGLHELEPTTCLTLGCKRLRPLTSAAAAADFDLKSESSYHPNKESTEVEGGRRWNPTQEQLGKLEMLYGGGMRAPNGRQIEQIAAELRNHGEIKGKNIFYWFQNHKARERQRQRRISLGLRYGRRKTSSPFTAAAAAFPVNRCGEGEGEDRTLKLFPLQPERRIKD